MSSVKKIVPGICQETGFECHYILVSRKYKICGYVGAKTTSLFLCKQKLKFWLHKTRPYSWRNWILWLERDCPTLNLYVHDFYLTVLNAFVS